MSSQRKPQTDPLTPHEPSSHPIFGIPDILEIILQYLNVVDLLVSVNRVSRLWHQVVNETPSLRRMHYFDPIPIQVLSGPIESDDTPPRPERVQNALLAAYFGECFFYNDMVDADSTVAAADPYAMQWTPWDADLSSSTPADVRQAFARNGASWRRMLLSQPPPPRLTWVGRAPNSPIDAPVIKKTGLDTIDSAGLRMGQLYDFLLNRPPLSHSGNLFSDNWVYWNHIHDDIEPYDLAKALIKESGLVILILDYTSSLNNNYRADWRPH